MKKIGAIIAGICCIALLCVGFYFLMQKVNQSQEQNQELTEVEKIITKDLSKNYPATPREVVKLYNRIITAYYKEEYTDEELSQMADQALCLFDDELRSVNPKDTYLAAVEADIASYKDASKFIAQSDVCESNDVLYKTIDGDDIAYVDASYFVREGDSYSKTYQTYVLRKDAEDHWKILVFYQVEAPANEDD